MTPLEPRTHAFHPVTAGFTPRSGGAHGFQLAAPYVREADDASAVALTFLAPPRPGSPVFQIGVNLTAHRQAPNSPEIQPPAPARTSTPSPTTVTPATPTAVPTPHPTVEVRERIVLDRWKLLREFTERIREAATLPAPSARVESSSAFQPVVLMFRSADTSANSRSVERAPASAPGGRASANSDNLTPGTHSTEVQPLALRFLALAPLQRSAGADGATHGGWISTLGAASGDPFTPHPASPSTQRTIGESSNTDRTIGSVAMQLVSVAPKGAGPALAGVPVSGGRAGALHADAIHARTVFLINARTALAARWEADSDGGVTPRLCSAARDGLTFATSTAARHMRTEDSLHVAATPVTMTVKTAPPAAPTAPRTQPELTFAPTPAPGPLARPQGLPADLVQRLTEQVVRALDARSLATRERFGRI